MLKRVAVLLTLFAFAAAAQQGSSPASTADQHLIQKVEFYLKNLFAWDSTYKVTLGPLGKSEIPDSFAIPVKVTNSKGQTETGTVYVTKDGHYMFRGEIRDLEGNPFADNLSKLHAEGFPAKGPANAKVTAVEFSDFECPHCREMFEILKTLEPEFPQIRFVFKDFPLTEIHSWAMTAALGARCVYQASPEEYWKFEDSVFSKQDATTADNAWDQITASAAAAGVNADSLHACMANPETKKIVDEEIAEGKSLSVDSTPTFFINGRSVINADKQILERILRFELARAEPR